MFDPNKKFQVMAYTIPYDGTHVTYEIYLLNVGDVFEGFGHHRLPLRIAKQASLIVRQRRSDGVKDTEEDLTAPDAWAAIREGVLAAQGHIEG